MNALFRTPSDSSLGSTDSLGDLSSLVPEQQEPRIGTTFVYELPDRRIKLAEDTAPGCGGKAWEAAVLLCDYLAHRCRVDPGGMARFQRVVELGAGTGLVGIVLAALSTSVPGWSPAIDLTDLDIFIPLAGRNADANLAPAERIRLRAVPLHWGEPLRDEIRDKMPYDLVLLADCIYLEALFDPLVSTLCTLTDGAGAGTEVWIAYKKRRKADKQFWSKLGKYFEWREVDDFPGIEAARRGSLYLTVARRKRR